MKIEGRVRFVEDQLFSKEVLAKIAEVHELEPVSAKRHCMIDGMEVDVVAFLRTPKGITRSVGFELKISDIYKALDQSKKRRKYFNYFYIVLGNPPYFLVDVMNYNLKPFVKAKVGIFCGGAVIVRSKFRKVKGEWEV